MASGRPRLLQQPPPSTLFEALAIFHYFVKYTIPDCVCHIHIHSVMSSTSTPTPADPSATSPSHGSAATLSVGLAIGMVFCLIAFVFISVAFLRVARRGDLFPRRPTARLRQEEEQRCLHLIKFMGRGTVSVGSNQPRPAPGGTPWSSAGPPLPLYTLPLPPPAYVPNPTLPPYDRGTSSS